jgi:hypothetical protein
MIRALNPSARQLTVTGPDEAEGDEGGMGRTEGEIEAAAAGDGTSGSAVAVDGKGATDGEVVEQAARSRAADKATIRGIRDRPPKEDRTE